LGNKEGVRDSSADVEEDITNKAKVGTPISIKVERAHSDKDADYLISTRRSTGTAPTPPAVGGCLQNFWKTWKQEGASNYVVNLLREGVKLTFQEKKPMSSLPIVMESYQGNIQKQEALRQAVLELKQKGVLETVKNLSSPGYYGRLFLTPKSENRWRPIIDMSGLNIYVQNETFHMETVSSIQDAMHPGMWVTTIDLTDAYYHILIHPDSRKYLRIALFGEVLQFRELPMGLNISARVFTKVVLELAKMVRKKGIHLSAYLDDWITKHYVPKILKSQTQYTVDLSGRLGWLINFPKSVVEPTQQTIYVGVEYQLQEGLA
jgi:hypothetical protein